MLIIDPSVTIMGSFFGDVESIFWIVAGLVGASKVGQSMMFGQGLAFLSGAVAGLGSGVQKKLNANGAGKAGHNWQDLKEGSRFRDNRFTRPINAIGRRVGAAQAGGGVHAFLPTRRGRSARSLYETHLGEGRVQRNPFLKEGQNVDDWNNVLALSGGSDAGARQAARDIFTDDQGNYDAARGNAAVTGARAMGINRGNAAAALKTSMANKARGIGAGNVRAVDAGIRRLARSEQEYTGFSHQAAAVARASGRADLGGTDWIDYDQTGNVWQEARTNAQTAGLAGQQADMAAWRYVADRTAINGIERTPVHAVMSGHDNQVSMLAGAAARTLENPASAPGDRIQAAMALKELHGGLTSGASGSARDQLNTILYTPAAAGGLGLRSNDPTDTIADQLARRTRVAGVTGYSLTNEGRVFPEQSNGAVTAAQQQQQQNQNQGQNGP